MLSEEHLEFADKQAERFSKDDPTTSMHFDHVRKLIAEIRLLRKVAEAARNLVPGGIIHYSVDNQTESVILKMSVRERNALCMAFRDWEK